MATERDKKLIGFTTLAILVIGIIGIAGHEAHLYFQNKEVRKMILAAHPNAQEDPNSGQMVWGQALKKMRNDHVTSMSMCGSSFEIKSEDGDLIEQSNNCVEKEYEQYFSGQGTKKFRKEYEKMLKEARFYGFSDEDARCIKVNVGCRSNGYQAEIVKRALEQGFRAADPGGSFHETCQAIDVANFIHAQKCLTKYGFRGGWRGLREDPYHFSRGEQDKHGWWGEKGQKAWYQKKRAGGFIKKWKFW